MAMGEGDERVSSARAGGGISAWSAAGLTRWPEGARWAPRKLAQAAGLACVQVLATGRERARKRIPVQPKTKTGVASACAVRASLDPRPPGPNLFF